MCPLRTDDVDPAHRTLRIRAETTKNRVERAVPYSASTGVLLSDCLAHRATISRAPGPLFLSESWRNHAQPLSLWTWSNVVPGFALFSGAERFSTHSPAPMSDRTGRYGTGVARDRVLCLTPSRPILPDRYDTTVAIRPAAARAIIELGVRNLRRPQSHDPAALRPSSGSTHPPGPAAVWRSARWRTTSPVNPRVRRTPRSDTRPLGGTDTTLSSGGWCEPAPGTPGGCADVARRRPRT
ncbi:MULTISPECIES: site-specific integrase [Streptomyces violaceusniger group]|uniref:hypothetical protein n=1 Tax=Streptomyces violaceusniger group TaxID=2839105 RepID=UPI001FC9A93C|nr:MULTISPECIES: hypothetical protein [Streptomyces violaceusniger group]